MRRYCFLLLFFLLSACAGRPEGMTPEQAAEHSRWVHSVRAHVMKRLYYPRDPNGPTIPPEGLVTVRTSIDGTGRSFTPQVIKSSGSPLLDAAAITIVAGSAPLPAPPAFAMEGKRFITLDLPLRFALRMPGMP